MADDEEDKEDRLLTEDDVATDDLGTAFITVTVE